MIQIQIKIKCNFLFNFYFFCLKKSWGSGTNPWGPEKDDQFSKPTHYDGMLEVVGIKGVVHMAQIQGGLSSAIRLAQGGRVSYWMRIHIHLNGY